MAEPLQTFEQKLARIEHIVKELEGAGTDLARATLLFKEGKTLIRDCDALLKSAETQIKEAGKGDELASSSTEEDELPF